VVSAGRAHIVVGVAASWGRCKKNVHVNPDFVRTFLVWRNKSQGEQVTFVNTELNKKKRRLIKTREAGC
jgi:hypothetical protein